VVPPLRSPGFATHHPSDPHTSPPSPSEHHRAKPWFPLPLAPPHMALPSPQSRRHPPPLQSPRATTRRHSPSEHRRLSPCATTPPLDALPRLLPAHHRPQPKPYSAEFPSFPSEVPSDSHHCCLCPVGRPGTTVQPPTILNVLPLEALAAYGPAPHRRPHQTPTLHSSSTSPHHASTVTTSGPMPRPMKS
jgi:hypothetical protein